MCVHWLVAGLYRVRPPPPQTDDPAEIQIEPSGARVMSSVTPPGRAEFPGPNFTSELGPAARFMRSAPRQVPSQRLPRPSATMSVTRQKPTSLALPITG